MKKKLLNVILRELFCCSARRILILLAIVLLSVQSSWSSGVNQDDRVLIVLTNGTFASLVEQVSKQTKYTILFKNEDVKDVKNLNINKRISVKELLTEVLLNKNLTFTYKDNSIVITKRNTTPVATKVPAELAVRVIDGKSPIPGATVIVKGTTTGAIADDNGASILKNLKSGTILEISMVGYKSKEVVVNSSSTSIIVSLEEDVVAVDDVVVTGYFNRKKESYTGVAVTFTGKDLRKISTGNLLSSLSMLDPSFTRVVDNEMGSNPNELPQFEIRGSGSLKTEYKGNPNMPTFILDGFEVSAQKVFDLDPNRVRSMTILKDAAATAIYGSRAANGIVVIETEVPKMGQLQVSYNGSLNLEIADLSGYDLMNSKEKLEYERSSGLFSQDRKPIETDGALDTYNDRLKLVHRGNNTDWIAIPIRKLGVGQKHAVTAEGGDAAFRYALDLFYSNKIGVMKGSKRDNYGGSIRLQYNYKRFKFTNYASFDHIKSVNSSYGNFSSYTYYNPYYNPYNEDGGVDKVLYEYHFYDNLNRSSIGNHTKKMYNSLYNALLSSKNESSSNNFLNNFSIEYNIVSGLKFKTNISISVDDQRSDKFLPSEHTSFIDEDKKGSYSQVFTKGFSYDINAIMTYFKQIERHTINIGLVYNIRESNQDASGLYAVGFANQKMDHIAMGLGFLDGAKPTGTYDMTRLIGVVGNIGYSLDDKYLLDASIRSDGSSIYGSNNRWGTFWSFGLGWNIAKENFLKESEVVDLLKLRGSIGTTGGQNFSPFQAMSMYSYNDSFISDIIYSGYVGAILKAYGNRNLKWQKINKRNIGLDFELFSRRVSGTFNYYNDVSRDVLVNVSIAPSLGFSTYMENLGKVKNSGVELTLRGSVIRNYSKGLRWDLFFNMVHNRNAVLEINNALTAFNNKQDSDVKNSPVVRYQEGMSINTIWANESLGIDPITGEEIFLDLNNKKTDKWSALNYKPLGNTDPKLYGTFGTTFGYKGWELNANFYYKFGGQIYNRTLADKIENVNPNENGDRRILYDRWNEVGDVAKYKRVSDLSRTYPTSRFIEKESLVQLQSISMSYEFNGDKLREKGIQRLRISAIGNEIFTASTIRMERGIAYPFARTFSISAQITF